MSADPNGGCTGRRPWEKGPAGACAVAEGGGWVLCCVDKPPDGSERRDDGSVVCLKVLGESPLQRVQGSSGGCR